MRKIYKAFIKNKYAVEMNGAALVGIVVSSIYGIIWMLKDIYKETIELFNIFQ